MRIPLPIDHQSESVQCCLVWPFSNSSTTLVSVWYHSCLLAAQLTTQTTGFFKRALFISRHMEFIVGCGMKPKSTFYQCHHCAPHQKKLSNVYFFVQYCLFVWVLRGPEVQSHTAKPNRWSCSETAKNVMLYTTIFGAVVTLVHPITCASHSVIPLFQI